MLPDAALALDSDAVSDLVFAATRARDLYDDVTNAVDRARGLVHETSWRARAAESFRDAVREWCAELVDIRASLADIEAAAGDAARRLQYRRDMTLAGASP